MLSEMENIDNKMAVSPEKIVLPNQSGSMNSDDGFGNEFLGSVAEQKIEETVALVSKKRGRPKQYVVQETMAEKRGRGRPRGSNNRISEPGSDNRNFTPYVVTIPRGKDIVEKVMSFIQIGVQEIFILAASGPISVVNLRPGWSDQKVIRYEGYFELLTLKGSLVDVGGVHNDMRTLSVSLAYPDGRVFGGAVCGCLIAAAPVQLILGIIKKSAKKKNLKKRSIKRPIPTVVSGNVNSPRAPTHNSFDPKDAVISPQGSTMSPIHVDEAIEDDKSEDHHAYLQRSDKNASQLSDQSEDHHMSHERSHKNTSQPSNHASSETLSGANES